MSLWEKTIDCFVPVELRTKQCICSLTIIEKMWAVRQTSGTMRRYLYRYALVIPVVLIAV